MKERPYDNRKARIEKKFSTEAMRLLMALMPRQYPAEQLVWEMACDAFEFIRGSDVRDALAEIEDYE